MRLAGHVTCISKMRKAYAFLVGKPERRPFGKPAYSWEDNIKMVLK
jgi:hypothetical protein